MVIYATGGTEGTDAEAASRTGRRQSGWKLPVKSFPSMLSFWISVFCMNTTFMCVHAQLCPHVHGMKGTDTRLVNNGMYNMNIWGVYPCFSCSLLQLIHMHNAHIHTTFSVLITFFSDKLLFHAYSIVTMVCYHSWASSYSFLCIFCCCCWQKRHHIWTTVHMLNLHLLLKKNNNSVVHLHFYYAQCIQKSFTTVCLSLK